MNHIRLYLLINTLVILSFCSYLTGIVMFSSLSSSENIPPIWYTQLSVFFGITFFLNLLCIIVFTSSTENLSILKKKKQSKHILYGYFIINLISGLLLFIYSIIYKEKTSIKTSVKSVLLAFSSIGFVFSLIFFFYFYYSVYSLYNESNSEIN